MREIIFATKNKGKIKEINEIMRDTGIMVISMEEAGIDIDIVEDGETFEENAIKKAVAIMKISGKIALSDDSGLVVDYLGGAPGIYSARFGGEGATDADKNEKVLSLLQGVPHKERTARFVCVTGAAFPDGTTITTKGTLEGLIAEAPIGNQGFGYDPIFFIPEYDRTVAQMDAAIKNQISHRGKALRRMKEELQQIKEKKE